MVPPDVEIVRAGSERLPELEPLFRELYEHHVALSPRLAGLDARTPSEAWERRCERYEQWLATADAFLLVAERAERRLGYVLVGLAEGYQTWRSAERVAEVHELVVAADVRGGGIGTALLDGAERQLHADGIREYRLLVIAANDDARRFYERRGMARVSDVMLGRIGAHDDVADGADASAAPDTDASTPRWRTGADGALREAWIDRWHVRVPGHRAKPIVAEAHGAPPSDARPIEPEGPLRRDGDGAVLVLPGWKVIFTAGKATVVEAKRTPPPPPPKYLSRP